MQPWITKATNFLQRRERNYHRKLAAQKLVTMIQSHWDLNDVSPEERELQLRRVEKLARRAIKQRKKLLQSITPVSTLETGGTKQ